MNESRPESGKRAVRFRRLCSAALILGVVALAGCALWLKGRLDERAAKKELQRRLDAIHTAGQPVDDHDLARLYPDPPSNHDAIRLLRPGLSLLVIPDYSTNLPIFGGDWPRGNAPFDKQALDEIQSSLDKNQKAFEAVPWVEIKTAWIGSSFENGSLHLPETPIHEIISLCKLMCLNAALEAESNNSTGAVQSLQRAWAIHGTLRNDTFVHGEAKFAMEFWNCATLNRVLNRTALTDSDLALLSDFLTRTNFRITRELLINQRSFGLSTGEELQALEKRPKSRFESTLGYIKGKLTYRVRNQDLVSYLDDLSNSMAALDLPLSNAIPKLAALGREQAAFEKQVEKRDEGLMSYLSGDKHLWLLFAISPTQVGNSLVQEAETLAYMRAARAALAIERWRLKHDGHPPDSLSELVPDFLPSVPIDPFADAPLHYKRTGLGYTIYSIGPDFTDDGGKEMTANVKESDHYDIVFSVTR